MVRRRSKRGPRRLCDPVILTILASTSFFYLEPRVCLSVRGPRVCRRKSGGASDVVSDANARAVSAFARALHKKDSLAVVRGIYRVRTPGAETLIRV